MNLAFSTDNLEVIEIDMDSKEFARKKTFMAMTSKEGASPCPICGCVIIEPKYEGLQQVIMWIFTGSDLDIDPGDEVNSERCDEVIALVHEFLDGLYDHIGPFELSEEAWGWPIRRIAKLANAQQSEDLESPTR